MRTRVKIRLWIMGFLLGWGVALAQVSLKTDTLQIRIGEQIQYEVYSDSLSHTLFPVDLVLDSLNKLEQVKSLPVDTLRNRLRKKYLITGFDSGYYHVPAQRIRIGDSIYLTDSINVKVLGVKVDTTKQKMYPIRPVISAPPPGFKDYLFPWIWWVLAIGIIAGLAGWLIRRKSPQQKSPVKPELPPLEEAVQALTELGVESSSNIGEDKIFYSRLTGIIRRYLERAVDLPALELPTDEWLYLLELRNRKNRWGLNKNDWDSIKNILYRADMIKFAKQKADSATMSADLSETEQWIRLFHNKTYRPPQTDTATGESPEKRKSSKNKTLVLILGILLVTGILSFILLKSDISLYLGKSSSELIEKQWFGSQYGHPSVFLETPEILQPVEQSISEQEKKYIRSASAYQYGNLLSGFSIYLSTLTVYPGTRLNMDEVIQNSLDRVLKTKGVTDLKSERSEVYIGETPATLLRIHYNNSGIPMQLFAYFIQQDNAIIQLIINTRKDDKKTAQIRERIVQSMKINKPETR